VTSPPSTTTLVTGLGWPECPRWHDGRLWFVDMFMRKVHNVASTGGAVETVLEVDAIPAGLGWLPDNSLIVVSMADRKLLRLKDGNLTEYADLSDILPDAPNDMVIDESGTCYVSNLGRVLRAGGGEYDYEPVPIAMVPLDGQPKLSGAIAISPNGMAIHPSGRFFVAEPMNSSIKSFSIGEGGILESGSAFAAFPQGTIPDGICVDANAAVWFGSPVTREVIQVRENAEILTRLSWGSDGPVPVAPTLGGPDGSDLFVCIGDVTPHFEPLSALKAPNGRIEPIPQTVDRELVGRIDSVRVDAKRGGLP
jgi:sugar lactone lactonase YvrE